MLTDILQNKGSWYRKTQAQSRQPTTPCLKIIQCYQDECEVALHNNSGSRMQYCTENSTHNCIRKHSNTLTLKGKSQPLHSHTVIHSIHHQLAPGGVSWWGVVIQFVLCPFSLNLPHLLVIALYDFIHFPWGLFSIPRENRGELLLAKCVSQRQGFPSKHVFRREKQFLQYVRWSISVIPYVWWSLGLYSNCLNIKIVMNSAMIQVMEVIISALTKGRG